MVKYISAKSTSLDDLLNKITPDFNSKLSSILKQASQPTWDLEEIRNKEPEETDLVYFEVGEDEFVPIQSTIKIYYKGTTDTDKIFYIDITKTMVVRYLENWESLIGKGFKYLEPNGADAKAKYVGEGPTDKDNKYEDDEIGGQKMSPWQQVMNLIKDWDDWIDAPNKKAKIDLQYNDRNIKTSVEVPVDKIDETIQEFVDKYIDV